MITRASTRIRKMSIVFFALRQKFNLSDFWIRKKDGNISTPILSILKPDLFAPNAL